MVVLKITKRAVEAARVPPKADAYLWDTELKGFGLRVPAKSVRLYVVQYRLPGRPARQTTIGIHGSPWRPDVAGKRGLDRRPLKLGSSLHGIVATLDEAWAAFVKRLIKDADKVSNVAPITTAKA